MSGWIISCSAQSGAHIITSLQGAVSVKRVRRTNFVNAYFGMPVNTGDIFRLDKPDSRAGVTCADGSTQRVERSPITLQCPAVAAGAKPVIPPSHDRKSVSKVRSGRGSDVFPVLVSPRMTNLLNPHPVIRWLPVRDATAYKVSVFNDADEVWSVHVGSVTEVRYTSDPQKALIPGKTYRVVISTGEDCGPRSHSHCSSEEGMANLGFSLLDDAEVRRVRKAENQIRVLHLPDVPTRFLLASLYAEWILPNTPNGKGLIAEAIEELEGLQNTQEPVVERRLAELYLNIGLTYRAVSLYLAALDLSTKAGDIEGQALAQHAVGQIFAKTVFNKNDALQRLRAARALYVTAGDPDVVREIDREIAMLSRTQTVPGL